MSPSPRLTLLLTLPPLMWAGNAVVGRLMVGQVPPLTLNALRWLLAAALLLPLAWPSLRRAGGWAPVRERWRFLVLLGVLGVGLYNALQYLALVSSTPINVTLVASSLPVWMLLVGAAAFGEHPTRRQIAGAALGLAGVLIVIGRGSLQTLRQVSFVAGDLYMLAAVIGWAIYSWLLARPPAWSGMTPSRRPDWDWAALLFVQVAFGALVACGTAAAEGAAGSAPIRWSASVLAALLFVAIGPSLIAYRCWGLGVAQGSPALAAFFASLTPLFAALFSALMLGEAPQAYHAGAFALIAGGIVVSSRRRAT
jgi:drug/metabolite transporter (DMT)-like permease